MGRVGVHGLRMVKHWDVEWVCAARSVRGILDLGALSGLWSHNPKWRAGDTDAVQIPRVNVGTWELLVFCQTHSRRTLLIGRLFSLRGDNEREPGEDYWRGQS